MNTGNVKMYNLFSLSSFHLFILLPYPFSRRSIAFILYAIYFVLKTCYPGTWVRF